MSSARTSVEKLNLAANRMAGLLDRLRISPMVVTWTSLPVGLAAAVSFGLGYQVLAGCLLLGAGILDTLDGRLARQTGRTSHLGALTDSSLDRIVDFAVLAGVLILFRHDLLVVVLTLAAMLFSSFISYQRAVIEKMSRRIPGGYWQRPERLVALSVAGLAHNLPMGIFVLAVGTFITASGRFEMAVRIARAMDRSESSGDVGTWNWLRRGKPLYIVFCVVLGSIIAFVHP